MKLIPYIKDNSKTIMAVTIVLLLILLFWNPCNKPGENVAKLKAENKELQKQVQHARDSIAQVRRRFTADFADARGREQLAVQEKQEADNKVKQQQSVIDRLTGIIRHSNEISGISGFRDSANKVLVSKEYKSACDSLPNEIDKLNASLAAKDSAINDWSDILAYEVQIRDSAIEAEQQHSARMNDLYERQTKITEAALKAAKPRGRLLGGIGLIGNELNPLSGTKINLAYQSKGGKQYQVGGLLMRGGVYYEATVLITLIK